MDSLLSGYIEEIIHTELHRHSRGERPLAFGQRDSIYESLVTTIIDDLYAYELRDPASRGDPQLILSQYPTFRAVLLYRVAHALFHFAQIDRQAGKTLAHRLSASTRLSTGIEIHPAARIGSRFVIDHGWGTIIGETTHIGADCYILGGVTLGAVGISNNPDGKRHPTIGDRVQIGGHARVLGNINIGDDCFIGPYTIVTEDVAANVRVLIVNQLQFIKEADVALDRLTIQGLVRLGDKLMLQISGVEQPSASIVSEDGIALLPLTVSSHAEDPHVFILESPPSSLSHLLEERRRLHLLVEDRGRHVLTKDLRRLFQHRAKHPGGMAPPLFHPTGMAFS